MDWESDGKSWEREEGRSWERKEGRKRHRQGQMVSTNPHHCLSPGNTNRVPPQAPAVTSSLHSPKDPSQSDADCAESDGVHRQSAQTEHSPRTPHGVRAES